MQISKNKQKKNFPFLKGSVWFYPKNSLCPVCKKNKVLEPHSMVVFEAGACCANSRVKDKIEGYMDIAWHEGHGLDQKGRKFNRSAQIVLAEDVKGGQFSFYFCSFKCFRKWFNGLIDNLEKQMKNPKIVDEKAELWKFNKYMKKFSK